jgi:hypothetical protein
MDQMKQFKIYGMDHAENDNNSRSSKRAIGKQIPRPSNSTG